MSIRQRIQYKSPYKSFKNKVHSSLKSGGCVAQSKRHCQEFIVSLNCTERCLMDVTRIHTNSVVPRVHIQL